MKNYFKIFKIEYLPDIYGTFNTALAYICINIKLQI